MHLKWELESLDKKLIPTHSFSLQGYQKGSVLESQYLLITLSLYLKYQCDILL